MSKAIKLNSAEVCAMFGISNMTLYSWRKGTKKMAPLPVSGVEALKGKVAFLASAVNKWAKTHGVVIIQTPEQVKQALPTQRKSGPKPRQPSAS